MSGFAHAPSPAAIAQVTLGFPYKSATTSSLSDIVGAGVGAGVGGAVHVSHMAGHIVRISWLIMSSPSHWSCVRTYLPQIGNSGVPRQSAGVYIVVAVDVEVDVDVTDVVSTQVPHMVGQTAWTKVPVKSQSENDMAVPDAVQVGKSSISPQYKSRFSFVHVGFSGTPLHAEGVYGNVDVDVDVDVVVRVDVDVDVDVVVTVVLVVGGPKQRHMHSTSTCSIGSM